MSGRSAARSPWQRRLLRPWVVVPVVALLVAGGWFAFGRKDKAGQASATAIERTVDVTSGPLTRTVTASGTIEAADTEDLSFTSSGTVKAVDVKAGDTVKKGEVLATVDSAALASAVTQAEASVADAEAKLSSDQTASATSDQLAADASNLASLQAQLAAAQTALAGAQLVSPIDGTISLIDLTVGQQLGSGGASGTGITGTGTGSGRSSSTLGSGSTGTGNAATQASGSTSAASASSAQVEVISTGAYVVKLNVDDTDIKNVKVGQRATITLASETGTNRIGGFGGFGGFARNGVATGATGQSTTTTQPAPVASTGTKTGLVTSVGTVATATSGVATFPVDVTFDGSADTYHAGATAEVEITYATIANTIQVPAQAVTGANGGSSVVLIADGKKQTRPVQTGITSNGMVQVTSGLKAGDQVVISITTARRVTGTQTGTNGGTGGFQPPAGFGAGGFTRGGGQGG